MGFPGRAKRRCGVPPTMWMNLKPFGVRGRGGGRVPSGGRLAPNPLNPHILKTVLDFAKRLR